MRKLMNCCIKTFTSFHSLTDVLRRISHCFTGWGMKAFLEAAKHFNKITFSVDEMCKQGRQVLQVERGNNL